MIFRGKNSLPHLHYTSLLLFFFATGIHSNRVFIFLFFLKSFLFRVEVEKNVLIRKQCCSSRWTARGLSRTYTCIHSPPDFLLSRPHFFNKGKKEPSPTHLKRSSLYSSEWFTFSFFYRATAFGILNGLCKFGAILGNTIFASFVGITKVVPILLAATSLVGGGLIALRLPETREQVLMWTTYQGKEMLEEPRLGTSAVPSLPVCHCPADTWIAQEEKLNLWPLA